MKCSLYWILILLTFCSCSKNPPGPLYSIQENDRFGFIDSSGHVMIEPQFSKVHKFKNDIAWVKTDEALWTLIDVFGKPVFKESFDSFDEIKVRYAVRRLCGEIDQFKLVQYPASYKIESKGRYGLVALSGKVITLPQYDDIGRLSDNMAWFKAGNSYGFIDTNGNTVIPAQFDEVSDFVLGCAWVRKNGSLNWTTIDQRGQQSSENSTSFPYEEKYVVKNSLLVLERDSLRNFLDEFSNSLYRNDFDLRDFRDAIKFIEPPPIELAYGWRIRLVIDAEMLTKLIGEEQHGLSMGNCVGPYFGEPEVPVPTIRILDHRRDRQKSGAKHYINIRRISYRDEYLDWRIIPLYPDPLWNRDFPLITVTDKYDFRRWSIIRLYPDSLGSPSWQDYNFQILKFSDGVALVRKREWLNVTTIDRDTPPLAIYHWGMIDTLGQFVQQPHFECEEVYPFHSGLATYRKQNRYGVIDKRFKDVIKPENDSLIRFGQRWAFQIKKKWGLINEQFEKVTQNDFDELEQFDGPLANFKKNGKSGYINTKGTIIWIDK